MLIRISHILSEFNYVSSTALKITFVGTVHLNLHIDSVWGDTIAPPLYR